MHTPLRIFQVINVRWHNATAWYAISLAKQLKELGHEVTLLGLHGTDSFARAEALGLVPVGIDLNGNNPLRMPLLLNSLTRLVREKKPHIINCHRGEAFPLFCLLKRMGFPFKLIRTRGDQRPPKNNAANRYLHNTLCDALIATNSQTRQLLVETLAVPEENTHLILGGVDRKAFSYSPVGRAALRKQWGVAPTDFLVGLLGRFDPVKGQKELMEAVAMAKKIHPHVRLLLAGLPAAYSLETVQGWAQELGLGDSIIVGHCEDVAACISAMDLGVVASLGSEAIARAALEIMSCGVPLVGTTVGVMPDLLPPDALVTPGDCKGMAQLLCRAAADAPWRENLQEACLIRMLPLDGQAFAEQTLHVYRAVLGIQ